MKLNPKSYGAHVRHEGMFQQSMITGAGAMDIAARYIEILRTTPRPSGQPMLYSCICTDRRDEDGPFFTQWFFAYATDEDRQAVSDAIDAFEKSADPDLKHRMEEGGDVYDDPMIRLARALTTTQACTCPFSGK